MKSKSGIITNIDNFFFRTWSPLNLGATRIFFYLWALYIYFIDTQHRWPHPLTDWGDLNPLWWSPIGLFKFFSTPPLHSEPLYYLNLIFGIAIVFSIIGLYTRLSTTITFFCSLILLGYPPSFGQGVGNSEGLFVIACLIFCLSRSGDSLSADVIILKKSPKYTFEGTYSWPVIVIRWLLLLLLFQAGFQKIRNGFSFFTTDHLAIHLYLSNNPIGVWISDHLDLSKALAALVVIFEVSAISAFFKKRLAPFFVVGFFIMQICFFYILGIRFAAFKGIYFFGFLGKH